MALGSRCVSWSCLFHRSLRQLRYAWLSHIHIVPPSILAVFDRPATSPVQENRHRRHKAKLASCYRGRSAPVQRSKPTPQACRRAPNLCHAPGDSGQIFAMPYCPPDVPAPHPSDGRMTEPSRSIPHHHQVYTDAAFLCCHARTGPSVDMADGRRQDGVRHTCARLWLDPKGQRRAGRNSCRLFRQTGRQSLRQPFRDTRHVSPQHFTQRLPGCVSRILVSLLFFGGHSDLDE
jgi:hypothetical protein